jgi:uncharacterized LabA/DUF88 family protein
MSNIERVQIFIDGGNFHHLVLRKLGITELNFSFEEFAGFLVNSRKVTPMGKRYYIGTVREQVGNPRSKEAMSKQTKLFTILKSHGWEVKTSKLRHRTEKIVIDQRVKNFAELHKKGVYEIEYTRMREKGIDVKLATDVIVGAVDDKYDTAIIISSDGDLVPAIDWVRNCKKKRVEYIGFSIPNTNNPNNSTRPLQTMINRTDIQRILVESDMRIFEKPFIQKRT